MGWGGDNVKTGRRGWGGQRTLCAGNYVNGGWVAWLGLTEGLLVCGIWSRRLWLGIEG